MFQLGTVTFEVAPFNVDSFERQTGADYAAKDVMASQRSREFMGEGDETITLGGVLFPHKFGGLSSMEELHKLRSSGMGQILVRGDGRNMGWFLIEGLRERHSYLDSDGVGKRIDFEINLTRSPRPSAASYASTLMRLVRLFTS